jgi:hypothetical protein
MGAIGRAMIRVGQRLPISNRPLLVLLDEFLNACSLEIARFHGMAP